MSKSHHSFFSPFVEDMCTQRFFFFSHWKFYWQKVLENRDMSSSDKNQAKCTQRALDLKESSGELQQRRREQTFGHCLERSGFPLVLIVSSNFRERLCYFSSLVRFLLPAAKSHSEPSLFMLTSVISLGFLLCPTCNVYCFLPLVLGWKDVQIMISALKRLKEEADRCMFSPGCSYYQWE